MFEDETNTKITFRWVWRGDLFISWISDESLGMGAGKTAKEEKEARKRKESRGRENEKRRRRRRRWRYDSSFSVYCQHSQYAALKASRISIYFFEAGKRDNLSLLLPCFEWYTGCWITTKREMRFLPFRATTRLRNVAIGTLADILSGHHDFVSMTTWTRTGRKTSKTEWVWNSDIPGQRECRNFKADSIGSVDRVAYLATSSLLLMRRERMHVFHGVR